MDTETILRKFYRGRRITDDQALPRRLYHPICMHLPGAEPRFPPTHVVWFWCTNSKLFRRSGAGPRIFLTQTGGVQMSPLP